METGTLILVYDDPITKKKPEGKAIALKCLQSSGFGYDREDKRLEYWKVRFIDDGSETGRLISV